MPLDVDDYLRPHFEALMQSAAPAALFDAHTHIGANDPDGMKQTAAELLAGLDAARARGVVFPMHEPNGYGPANDAVLEAARASNGRLVAFCRVDPRADAVSEARRCLDAGARGIKLHPRAEAFALSEPTVRDLVAVAHERRVPVLIHAGRGIPALGRDTVELSGRFPDARLILAHGAISDLAWLWRELPGHPNVFVDTSWWHPSDLVALFALAPPGQVLWASDTPYGAPTFAAIIALRCALQAGLTAAQIDGVMGGQLVRLLAGEEPVGLGEAPGPRPGVHPLLERVVINITGALQRLLADTDLTEPLELARLACAVGDDGPHAELMSEILELLDAYLRLVEPPPPGSVFPAALALLVIALVLARTPAVVLPARPDAPSPERDAIDAA